MTGSAMAPADRVRQRWRPRFSLRTALLLITAVALILALWGRQYAQVRRIEQAVKDVQKLHARMADQPFRWISGTPITIENRPAPWWLGVVGQKSVPHVTGVEFDLREYDDGLAAESKLRDDDLRPLQQFTNLQQLTIPRSLVGDTGLERLTSFRYLQFLDLSETEITDRGLAALAKLPALEKLILSGQRLNGAGLANLARCSRLKELDLYGLPTENEFAAHLNDFHSLESLSVHFSKVDRFCLRALPKLRSLDLKIYDASTALEVEISQLPKLERLTLQSPHGIKRLSIADLPSLKGLTLYVESNADSDYAAGNRLRFESLPQLESLTIVGNDQLTEIVTRIGELKNLRSLDLDCRNNSLPNTAAHEIGRLTRLESVSIQGSQFTNDGLRELANLKALVSLACDTRSATADGIRALATLPKLIWLDLGYATGDGLAEAFQNFAGLERLRLSNCRTRSLEFVGPSVETGAPFGRLRELLVYKGRVESVRVRGLRTLVDLDLDVPESTSIHVDDLPKLERLSISLEKGQVVEKCSLAALPLLRWLSFQCGPEGAKVPADTFKNLARFPKLHDGIIWGLDMPPAAQADVNRWESRRRAP